MLLPALYRLTADGVLDLPIVGVAKTDLDLAGLRGRAREAREAKHGKVDDAAFESSQGTCGTRPQPGVSGPRGDRDPSEPVTDRRQDRPAPGRGGPAFRGSVQTMFRIRLEPV
ncbi:hypothetical protein BJY14_004837 [Actinomadura luteofluorescens]|uniref:Uncharacterized protein n=1 Tax=Actinomadura luteofluorescens TaxID=46163 RepID=A0A7Y9EJJ5_9ACTN|nr:hypothetical protein [Actinomadura luteofluorescens]NYD48854.1 hypothetical protein [Actinomadura luteofluorescens]